MANKDAFITPSVTPADPAPGHTDLSFCVINDVVLEIPPENITIRRQTMNHEWTTIRTKYPQKSKSGHGVVEVFISAVFKGNDQLNNKLSKLIAGLRATPFCVVYNKMIEDSLNNMEKPLNPMNKESGERSKFQPTVLANVSADVSTVPGQPDCLQCNMAFQWFNYYPYLNIWAYRTGRLFNQPGAIWESELWPAFYKPFLKGIKYLDWPHAEGSESAKTTLWFREFSTVPNVESLQATKDLLNILKQNPDEVIQTLVSLYDNTEIKVTSQNVYDLLYKKLGRDKNININDEMRKRIEASVLPDGIITTNIREVIGDLFGDSLARYMESQSARGTLPNEVDQAIKALDKKIQNSEQQEQALAKITSRDRGSFQKLENFSVQPEASQGGKKVQFAGQDLYGRKARLNLTPDEGFVVEQIQISFQNLIATIPMAHYRYPTCQFMGNSDINIRMAINCTNAAAARFQTIYEIIENNHLRYKMIPQGFLNPWLTNDLLNFFNVREIMTKDMVVQTIPGEPGRSQIILEFTHPGILSDTQYTDPETLRQEFVPSTVRVFKEINKILWNTTKQRGGNEYVPQGNTHVNYYHMKPTKGGNNPRYQAFISLLKEYVGIYNEFLTRVNHTVFGAGHDNSGYFFKLGVRTDYQLNRITDAAGIILYEDEDSNKYGYYPNIGQVQNFLIDKRRVLAEDRTTGFGLMDFQRGKVQRTMYADGVITDERRAIPANAKDFYVEDVDPKTQRTMLGNRAAMRREAYGEGEMIQQSHQETGVIGDPVKLINAEDYLRKMRALFDRIQREHIWLPEFKSVLKLIKQDGVGQVQMCYEDFKPQIKSVVDFVAEKGYKESRSSVSATSSLANPNDRAALINYNPDLYMWNPVFDGGVTNLEEFGLIDVRHVKRAEKYAISSYQSAQKKIPEFFRKNYLPSLQQGNVSAPADALAKTTNGGELQGVLYRSKTWKNATRENWHTEEGDDGKLKKEIVPDADQHAHINSVPQQAPFNSTRYCEHTADITAWVNGVSCGAGDSTPSPSNSNSGYNDSGVPQTEAPRSVNEGVERYLPYVKNAAQANGIPVELILAIIRKESSFNPRATSNVGAKGLMQTLEKLIDPTTKRRTLLTDEAKYAQSQGKTLYDPKVNITAGTKLFAKYYRLANRNAEVALAFYNMGRGNVLNWQKAKRKLRSNETLNSKELKAINTFGEPSSPSGNIPRRTYDRYTHKILDVFLPQMRNIVRQSNIYNRTNAEAQAGINEIRRQSVDTGVTSSMVSPLKLSIDAFQEELYQGQGLSLMRAYPTVKLFFFEDDQSEWRMAYDDFFSYNGIQSVRIVRSRKIAADLCELYLTNISGTLSNRKFRQGLGKTDSPRDKTGAKGTESDQAFKVDTKQENPLSSLLLKEGTHISLQLGYSSDPKQLDLVFTGVVTEVAFSGSGDLVRVLAQSYAIELVQDVKGFSKPLTEGATSVFGWTGPWGLDAGASTAKILEEMITQPEVVHFGRWTPTRQVTTPLQDLLTNKYRYQPTPQDDNIFPPHPDDELRGFGGGLDGVYKRFKYTIYRTTIWDIFQEMTLRNPNYIASPVPYRARDTDRMTMFYGLPNQLYFARDATHDQEFIHHRIKQEVEVAQKELVERANQEERLRDWNKRVRSGERDTNILALIGAGLGVVDIQDAYDLPELPEGFTVTKYGPVRKEDYKQFQKLENKRAKLTELAKTQGFIRPFRGYHLLTSRNHIIANDIQANSRDVANTVVVKYGESIKVSEDDSASLDLSSGSVSLKGFEDTMTVKLDAALPTEETRTQLTQFMNAHTPDLAKRYGLGMLVRNMKEVYKGNVSVLGNPKIKPYDVCYMFDEYNDMLGPIEVEQVIHTVDQRTGFRTEIVPDMLVQASEVALMSSSDAMSIVVEGAFKDALGNTLGGFANALYSVGSAASDLAGGLGVVGSLLVSAPFGPLAMGAALSANIGHSIGGLVSQKVLTYTQLAHPLVMTPLQYQGRPFTGGVPTQKIPKSAWSCMFGEWTPMAERGWDQWLEDKVDALMVGIQSTKGLITSSKYSQGDFFKNFNDLEVK